ncbi:MAG TPA: NUDIX domain-containing protein [Candidatus Paceibacterota bacterium]
MDLQINVGDSILYIRTAGIIRTKNGILFEKHPKGYIYLLGGKIQIDESSDQAIKREIKEEIDFTISNVKLISVLENFFPMENGKIHEICFVYDVEDIFIGQIPENMTEVKPEDLGKHQILPLPIGEMLKNKDFSFKHLIIRQADIINLF